MESNIQPHQHHRAEDCTMEERIMSLEQQLPALKEQLARNTELTEEIADILRAAKTFFRFADWAGKAIRWSAATLAAGIVLWKFWVDSGRH